MTSADLPAMGIVYLAVRSDDHYFQIVAFKIVRKAMESLALLLRFRAERQILATLTILISASFSKAVTRRTGVRT